MGLKHRLQSMDNISVKRTDSLPRRHLFVIWSVGNLTWRKDTKLLLWRLGGLVSEITVF